jgi:hypothetical protein
VRIATTAKEQRFSELFIAYLLTRNSRIEEDLVDQLFNSSEKRLARLLLLLSNFGKEGSLPPVKLGISQEKWAEMIGTTRSRVSFFMNKFRRLGLISYNGKIEVHSSLLSAVLHDKPEISGMSRGKEIALIRSRASQRSQLVRPLLRRPSLHGRGHFQRSAGISARVVQGLAGANKHFSEKLLRQGFYCRPFRRRIEIF